MIEVMFSWRWRWWARPLLFGWVALARLGLVRSPRLGDVQRMIIVSVAALALLAAGCSPTTYTRGVPNLERVEDGLWRSGQPTTAAEWAYLKSLGIRHVIKLNYDHEGADDLAVAAGLDVHVLSIHPDTVDVFAPVDAAKVAAALEVIRQQVISSGPGVLVHCTHGQDRTGLVIGLWRVTGDRWRRQRAYDEMIAHHFHPSLVDLQEYWERATRGVP